MDKKIDQLHEKMDKHQKHLHRINIMLILKILLVILLILMVKPALTGYKISQQFEDTGMTISEFLNRVNTLESEKLVLETNLESCNNAKQDYLKQVADEKNVTYVCQSEKSKAEAELDQQKRECEFNVSKVESDAEIKVATAQAELDKEKERCENIEGQFTPIIDNAVNNLCCKARIDNRDIDSYIVSNNKIICTIGEENKINCN